MFTSNSSVRELEQQQSYKELKLSLQRLDKQIHLFQYTKIRETHLFLVNNKLLVNEKILASRLESLMEEVRNVIYLPNYDFDMVADNLSVAKSLIEDLCGPLNLDE